MAREVKDWWLREFRAVVGQQEAEIAWNALLGRWEFSWIGLTGERVSQFLEAWDQPIDPYTGQHPFRDLNDDTLREVVENCRRTHLANRFDGAGTARKAHLGRMRFNADLARKKFRAAGELFADMVHDRAYRMRGDARVNVPVQVRDGKIEVPVVVGGRGKRKATSTQGNAA